MENQEIFNFVKDHLLSQKAQSFNDELNACAYYDHENNLTCAVGCLIDEDAYSPAFEGMAVSSVLSKNDPNFSDNTYREFEVALSNSIGKLTEEKIDLLNSLQVCHDSHNVANWETELKNIAKNFYLSIVTGKHDKLAKS